MAALFPDPLPPFTLIRLIKPDRVLLPARGFNKLASVQRACFTSDRSPVTSNSHTVFVVSGDQVKHVDRVKKINHPQDEEQVWISETGISIWLHNERKMRRGS